MIAAERTAIIILAAGRATRFGGDKLCADLWGRPIAQHIVETLANLPFLTRVAVVGGTRFDFRNADYQVVENVVPEQGLSSSIRLGIQAARSGQPDAVLMVLADMPLVSPQHISRILCTASGEAAIIGSSDGERPSPPALFGSAHFDALEALREDKGARDLILSGQQVFASRDELRDIDTIDDLLSLRQIVQGSDRISN